MFKRRLVEGSCNSDSVQHPVADVSTVKFVGGLAYEFLSKFFFLYTMVHITK